MDTPSSLNDIGQSKPCAEYDDVYSCESQAMIHLTRNQCDERYTKHYQALPQGVVSLRKLNELWLKYGGGRFNTQYDDAVNPRLLKMLSESESNCFTEVRRVAQALARNNERGFELFEKRPKRDPIKGILHQIESR